MRRYIYIDEGYAFGRVIPAIVEEGEVAESFTIAKRDYGEPQLFLVALTEEARRLLEWLGGKELEAFHDISDFNRYRYNIAVPISSSYLPYRDLLLQPQPSPVITYKGEDITGGFDQDVFVVISSAFLSKLREDYTKHQIETLKQEKRQLEREFRELKQKREDDQKELKELRWKVIELESQLELREQLPRRIKEIISYIDQHPSARASSIRQKLLDILS